MNHKTSIQTFLVILVILLSSIFYFKYFKDNSQIKITATKNNDKTKLDVTTVKDITYKSEDQNGNIYVIKSDFGEFKDQDKNVIFMTKVNAIIKFIDGTSINLTSDNANYNTFNNDTNFFNKVKLRYLDHDVNSDNLDIFFQESKLEAYNNLVYRNLDLNLIADKVEVDLITKNSKIFMYDDKKVRVIKNN